MGLTILELDAGKSLAMPWGRFVESEVDFSEGVLIVLIPLDRFLQALLE